MRKRIREKLDSALAINPLLKKERQNRNAYYKKWREAEKTRTSWPVSDLRERVARTAARLLKTKVQTG